MHFLRNDETDRTRKGWDYWRDVVLSALSAVAIIVGIGRGIDWLEYHRPADRNMALGFLLAYGVFALLAPNRYKYIFYSLVGVIAFGFLGAISHASTLGLPVIVCSALLAYLLFRWKGDDLLK